MDVERLLLSKAAQTGRIQNLLLAGIRPEHFSSESFQGIFNYISEQSIKYRQPPSFQRVKDEFSDFNFELTEESFEYLLDEFKKKVKRRYAVDAVRDLVEAIDDENQVGEIDTLFLEKSRELATVIPSARIKKFSDMDTRIDEYEATDPKDQRGIQMGIPSLDEVTLGIQPHEYATIMGWSGTGKSTLAQWILFNAWAASRTSMLISLEMESHALFRKWDTMITNFEYNKLKAHELREEDIEKWRGKAASVKDHPGDIIVMDDIRNFTVDRAYAEILRWKPDIVCIDYITLMDTQRSVGKQTWEKIQYLTQNLKQIARTTKTPIIGVAQTNRASADVGAELDNVAFGMSIIQDSDLVLGLYQNEEMKTEKQMRVKLLKNRDGQNVNADLFWKMNTMEFGPWKETMAFKTAKSYE